MAKRSLVSGGQVISGKVGSGDSEKKYGAGTFVSNDGKTVQPLGTKGVKDTSQGLVDAYQATYATPKSEVSGLSTENATSTLRNAQEREKALMGDASATSADGTDTTGTSDTAGATSIDDLTKLFKDSDIPLPAELSLEGQAARQDLDRLIAGLDTFRISDAELRNQTRAIVDGYDARIRQMEDINRRREQTFETLGFRTGARFSGGVRGGVFGGIISEEERQGVNRIAELEAAKQADILAAKKEARAQNYDVYVQKINNAEKKYQEQIALIEKLNKLYIDKQKENEEEEKAMNKIEHSITVDRAIGDLMSQGITDPKEILDMLNYDEAGELIGDVTLKEIRDSMKLLDGTAGLEGASAGIKDFKLFFPNVDLSTPEGYQKFLRFKAQTAAAGREPDDPNAPPKGSITSGTLTYTPADKADDAASLEATRGEDGWVNSETYRSLYNAWVHEGGTVDDFLKEFPPKLYTNPADDTLPIFLKVPKKKDTEDDEISDEQLLEALRGD